MINWRFGVRHYSWWCLSFVVFFVFSAVPQARAQADPNIIASPLSLNDAVGTPPYTTFDGEHESISLGSGALHLQIPLLSLPQLGGRSLDLAYIYDSKFWNMKQHQSIAPFDTALHVGYENACLGTAWCVGNTPLKLNMPTIEASIGYRGIYISCAQASDEAPDCSIYEYFPQYCVQGWTFTDWSGTKHAFSNVRDCPVIQGVNVTGSQVNFENFISSNINESKDSSYIRLDTTNPQDIVVTEKDGTQYHFSGYTPSTNANSSDVEDYYSATFSRMTDTNGNNITFNATTSTITDTVGRKITVNPSTISYTDSNGTPQTISAASTALGSESTFVFPQGNSGQPCTFTNPQPPTSTLPRGLFQPGPPTQSNTIDTASGQWAVNGPSSNTYAISFPGGRAYQLTYDILGQLTQIVYPGGGYTRYDYSSIAPISGVQTGALTCSVESQEITAKHVCSSSNGSCDPGNLATTSYVATLDGTGTFGNLEMDVTDPLLNLTQHKFIELWRGTVAPRETDEFIYSGKSTLMEKVHTDLNVNDLLEANGLDLALPQAITTTDYTGASPQVKVTTYTYDTQDLPSFFACTSGAGTVSGDNGYCPFQSGQTIDNPISVTETDFSNNIIRTTVSSWQKGGIYDGAMNHILDHLTSKTVTDNSTNVSSVRSYGYDSVGNINTVTNSGTGSAPLITQYMRNSNGDVIQVTDPKNNPPTAFGYTSPWYDSTCVSGTASAGKPSSMTDALGHITTALYYSCSGLLAKFTDPNKATTIFEYDALGRLKQRTNPDGGGTSISIVDSIPNTVTSTVAASPDPSIVATTVLDGLSRPSQVKLTSDPQGTVYIDTTYDLLERVESVSNPYRSTTDSTYGLIGYAYDALGRKTVQCQPDNGTAGAACQPKASFLQWSYANNVTTYTDEAGHSWQRTSDALGRLTQVVEPTGASTIYTYDALNNLLNVNQKGVSGETPRTRSFSYDALSRLLSATNPETGTISYQYATNGALCAGDVSLPCSKTDGRGIKASYTYDALNRLMQKSFSDGTSPIVYVYDMSSIGFSPSPADASRNLQANLSNSIGRLSAACQTPGSTCDAFSYDSMGRVVQQWTSLPGYNINGEPVYSRQAAYDLAGNVTSLTYPDGRVVTQGWDAGGHQQTSTFSSWNGQNSGSTYLSRATYWPNGAVQNMFYGNGVGIGRSMNNRLQVNEIGGVQLSGGQSYNLFIKVYCYGPATAPLSSTIPGCDAVASANNGNVWEVKDALNSSRSQTYTYDTLNRITSFSLGGLLSQQYGLDSFGNMGIVMAGVATSTFDPATNRINNLPCANTEAPYDGAGNQFCDTGQDGTVRQIAYDANNQISQIATAGNTPHPFVVYDYDGNGNRVRKSNSDGTFTEYLHFNGQPIAELNSDGTWSDYIYANGQKIAKADNYDVRIHLSGTNCSNCGSNPNMFAGTTSLTAANGYIIRSGDILSWRQYQDGSALGGLITSFTDGSTANGAAEDSDGQLINADTTKNTWHQRQVDLSAYAGKTVVLIDPFDWTAAPAGAWDIYYGNISLTSKDGTVIPLYNGSTMTLSLATNPTISNFTAVTERVANGNTETSAVSNVTTSYYLADALGTTQTELSSGGWPLWQGQFTPFGMERDTQFTPMHYKFTGKERDSESGLDYFGARYYGSSMGRWMSPDWADKPEAVPYSSLDDPQTLNLYGYVRNNPLSKADPDGHCPFCPAIEEALQYVADSPAGEAVSAQADKVVSAIGTAGVVVAGFVATHGQEIMDANASYYANGGSGNTAGAPLSLMKNGPAAPAAAPAEGEKTPAGPKAATAPGVTAGGQATNEHGQKLGPSGKPQVNNVNSNTREGAKNAGNKGSGTVEHPNPKEGDPHFHTARGDGTKVQDSTHYNYPK